MIYRQGVNCPPPDWEMREKANDYFKRLRTGEIDMTGWVNLPMEFDDETCMKIHECAEEIREKCTLVIVVGIGGSYLGAKATLDALNGSKPGYPEVQFAGYSMSAARLAKLTERMKNEATCIIVISKSGKTTEPILAFSVIKQRMFAKYGFEESRKRIYVITGEKSGYLRQEVIENGFKSFPMAENIGGRYSVLSAVGLLPIACAGHSIRKIMEGARKMAEDTRWTVEGECSLFDYAISRVKLQESGLNLEVFEYFETNLRYFGEWLKQLFGESEGKDGKGAYPASLCFSRDLHSVGQFLQQGKRIFYETMIRIDMPVTDFDIPWDAGYPYAGRTLETINKCAEEGVILAHEKDGIVVNRIEIDTLDTRHIGKLIYFFEISAAVSAYLLGVDPFDQPGVDFYKDEMKKLVIQSGK